MNPEEVRRTLAMLLEVADNLAMTRARLAELSVKSNKNGGLSAGTVKRELMERIAASEAVLRAALEPIGTSTLDDV